MMMLQRSSGALTCWLEGWNEIADGLQIYVEDGMALRVADIGERTEQEIRKLVENATAHPGFIEFACWERGEGAGEQVGTFSTPIVVTPA